MSQDTNDSNKTEEVSQSAILTMMTTEHYNLQGARSATVSEATGRANLYLSSISGVLVTLGFVGQASKMGDTFLVFSLVLLPSLFFWGTVTFVRILETSIEDFNYARGINRIRHYYLEIAPHLRKYFVLSDHDDPAGIMSNMGVYSPRGQTLISTTGLIGVINSVIGSVFVALSSNTLFSTPLVTNVIIGLGIFMVSLALHQFYSGRKWQEAGRHQKTLFPTPPTRS